MGDRLLQALPADSAGKALAAMPRAMALEALLGFGAYTAQRVLDSFDAGQRGALLSHLSVQDALRLTQA